MIARIWRGRTPDALADEYFEFLKRTGVPLYRRTPGNRGIHLLRRSNDGATEFLLLTFWDSLENVRPISGPDPERAYYFAEDERFLLELEPRVQHFEAWQA